MTLRRLLLCIFLTCVSAKAQCATAYINQAPDTLNNLFFPFPTLIPILERVKVYLFVSGDNVSSIHVFDNGDQVYYENGQEVFGPPQDVLNCYPELLGGGMAHLANAHLESPAAAPAQSTPTGQTNESVALADFNGDGIIDSAVLTTSGVTVNLLNSDGTTSSTATYPVAGVGPSILTADFNGDGFADLAITETDPSGQGNVVILLGKGNGTFGPATKFPAGPYAFYVATGDFNGDGSADLAVTNSPSSIGTASTVSVLLGNGKGTFASPVSYNVGEFPGTIVAADFNGDGKMDLAALDNAVGVSNYVNKVWVLLGKGDGTFLTAVSTATGTGSGYLAYAVLSQNGRIDLVIADEFASAAAIMMGNGDGTFQPPAEYVIGAQPNSIAPAPLAGGNTLLATADNASASMFYSYVGPDGTVYLPKIQNIGSGPTSIAAADLNGDGQPDLVITDAEAGNIYVKLATGSGNFGNPVTYALGSQPGALAIADVNRDGNLDVVAADATGLDVLLGKGSGALGPVTTFASGGSLSSVAIEDFNADGKPDVAAANPSSGGVALFLGNGDGTFRSAQTILLAEGSVPLSAVGGDFNGDGNPDLIVAFSPADNTQPGGLAVLLGKGNGTFQAPSYIKLPGPIIQQITGSASSAALAVGDLNRDGKLDAITAIQGAGSNQVAVLLGNGDGTFQAPILTNTNTSPPMLVITDQNDDGIPDLLLADCCGLSEASLLFGNGDGSFQPEWQFPSGPNPRAIATADFSGAGFLDAAVIGQIQQPDRGTLAILFNPFNTAIQTNPPGLQFSVDLGTVLNAPYALTLSQGMHTITVASPQAGAAGVQYAFANWSDGGAASHQITVGASDATYTANFTTRDQLTISASPAAGGNVTPPSGTYYNSGTAVPVSATANPGYTFNGWTGSVASASSASTTVTMSAPETVTANFTQGSGLPQLTPTITLVANAESQAAVIASNTWVEIKGSGLAPAGDTRIWAASDFVNGQMPTNLDGVSVTVNGAPAYIYYISPAQVNVLTPPGAPSGSVPVVLTNGTPSAAFSVQAQAESLSFFVFNGGPYIAATHLNGGLIGPTTLYPGASTPAAPDETIVIYANGFGATSVPVAAGAETQSGTLSPLPVITIGGIAAMVEYAGLSGAPGEFQFNVVVPPSLSAGDQAIVATYSGLTTQAGTLVTVN
jgi:uncharacterized protein (TIGR03437 family)